MREICATQFRVGQVCAAQVRAGQDRAVQDRVGQVRVEQVREGQVRGGQVRDEQIRFGQVREVQFRAGQVRVGQVHASQVGVGQVGAGQIRAYATFASIKPELVEPKNFRQFIGIISIHNYYFFTIYYQNNGAGCGTRTRKTLRSGDFLTNYNFRCYLKIPNLINMVKAFVVWTFSFPYAENT